ncbi:helix-turn-helix transcriptional regulator [Staphylococcus casei]|uniref:Helix-turn-helix transcriptional regulator n=1 Tax=Staphylococcus casei TaxID=201828 RepID=A0ABZ2W9Y7_9STAP
MSNKPFEIGEFLKTLRNDSRYSLRKLEDKMSFSRSYINNVENGNRKDVSEDFIYEYVNTLVENKNEANEIFKYINESSDGKLKIDLTNNNDTPFSNDSINKFMDTHVFRSVKSKIVNGRKESEVNNYTFSEDINDLHFHLKDNFNTKYYKDSYLDKNDLKNIESMIQKYLAFKIQTQLDTYEKLRKENKITDEITDTEKDLFIEIDGIHNDD